jgi:hypothetical protein
VEKAALSTVHKSVPVQKKTPVQKKAHVQKKAPVQMAMHQRALDGREKVLGPEHPDTIESVDGLVLVLWERCKHEAAESMHRRALDWREKVLGRGGPANTFDFAI